MSHIFSFRIRSICRDIDQSARFSIHSYLKWLEECRMLEMSKTGPGIRLLLGDGAFNVFVVSQTVEVSRAGAARGKTWPFRPAEEVVARQWIHRVGNTSLTFGNSVSTGDTVLCTGLVTCVGIGKSGLVPLQGERLELAKRLRKSASEDPLCHISVTHPELTEPQSSKTTSIGAFQANIRPSECNLSQHMDHGATAKLCIDALQLNVKEYEKYCPIQKFSIRYKKELRQNDPVSVDLYRMDDTNLSPNVFGISVRKTSGNGGITALARAEMISESKL